MRDPRPAAILSCDIDTVDRHLQGYGFEDVPACDLVYRVALPRILDLLDDLRVPCVFFVIARDAERQRDVLRAIAARGHEIASHSLTHPQPFRTLSDERLREELAESRKRLSAAIDAHVIGFRAPGWDADARVLRMVRDAGYRYDASMFPTPALLAARLVTYLRSGLSASTLSMELVGHAFAPTRPHALGNGADGLVEFPVAVTPSLRFPVYHTLSYLIPAGIFRRSLRRVLRSAAPLSYEFHAADLLELVGDRVDARMARHPGMGLGLAEKRRVLREAVATIADERRVVTYRDVLAERDAA